MYFLSHTFRLCYIATLMKLLHGYLLFAANMDDFHEIAKKLVPEQLAHKLSKIASSPIKRYSEDKDERSENSYEVTELNIPDNFKIPKTKARKRKIQLDDKTNIDFEELVERVKKRLEKELKVKYNRDIPIKSNKKDIKTDTFKDTREDYYNDGDKSEYVDEITDKTTKFVSRKPKLITEKQVEYADSIEPYNKKKRNIKEKPRFPKLDDEKDEFAVSVERYNKKNKKGKLKFPKLDVGQEGHFADSIELYDTNKRKVKEKPKLNNEEEGFSDSLEPYKKKKNDIKRKPKFPKLDEEREVTQEPNEKKKSNTKEKPKKEIDYDSFKKIIMTGDSYEDYKTPEKEIRETVNFSGKEDNKRFKIKGNSKVLKTDNIRKASDVQAVTEDIFFEDTISGGLKRSSPGTVLPKRDRYTIITPNYISPQPGEKYDFNEPIPEKDRERENLKYIGNPPASINKKVRLI